MSSNTNPKAFMWITKMQVENIPTAISVTLNIVLYNVCCKVHRYFFHCYVILKRKLNLIFKAHKVEFDALRLYGSFKRKRTCIFWVFI